MTKPFSARELLARVSTHLQLSQVRKQAAAAIREKEDDLLQLLDFQTAMTNNMAEGVYTVDKDGLLTFVNRAAEVMFGWTKEELLGKKMHDITHYKRPDGTLFPASECPGLQVLEKGLELREHEDAFIRKDGTPFPVIFSASPLLLRGELAGIVVGFRENRRELEQKLNESEGKIRWSKPAD